MNDHRKIAHQIPLNILATVVQMLLQPFDPIAQLLVEHRFVLMIVLHTSNIVHQLAIGRIRNGHIRLFVPSD